MNEGSATVGVDGDVFCGHNKGRLGLAATGTTLNHPSHYQTLAITIVRITIVKCLR